MPPLLLLQQANASGPRTSGRRQPMMPICLALYPSLRKKRLRKGKRQERAEKYRKYHACEIKKSRQQEQAQGSGPAAAAAAGGGGAPWAT